MLNRSPSLPPAVAASSRLQKPRFSKYILVGAIAPATLLSVQSVYAVDRFLPPDYTINTDTGAPVYNEGLQEGFLGRNLAGFTAADDETTPNPKNSSPELGIREGQENLGDPPDPDGFPRWLGQ